MTTLQNNPSMQNEQRQYIKPRDFIDKAISNHYISQANASTFYNDLWNSTISLIEKLLWRWFINEANIKTIAEQLGWWKLSMINWVKDLFPWNSISSFIPQKAKEIFLESIKFKFDKLFIAIYDIDHNNKQIHIIIPIYPTEDISVTITEFKKTSEVLRKVQKVDINRDDWMIITVDRSMEDYKFKIKIAPLSIIKEVITANMTTGDLLVQWHAQVKKQAEKEGFELWTKQEVISIEWTLDENKNTIEWQVQLIFETADSKFWTQASDIHLEPYLHAQGGQIRFRVNGELTEPAPAPALEQYILELKRMANLNIQKKQVKQDWKISLKINGKSYLFRVSTMPIGEQKQEKMVLRRLTNDPSKLNLSKMKMDQRFQNMLFEIIWDPHNWKVWKFKDGLILMTWPTGSWKSTTLFSILNHLNTPDVNIITLEDPIEYELPGINQSYIFHTSWKVWYWEDPNDIYTFEEWIKASLRQDPDIILVWEIRDGTTMSAAQVAASTWHLVLSSLHTNNTWETLNRLIWLWLEIDLIQSVVRIIMAQRLAQYVCPYCAKEYNDPSFSKTQEESKKRDAEYLRRKMEIYTSLLETDYIGDLPDDIKELKLYEGVGCPHCRYTWKYWRVGIYELLPIDLDIQDFLLDKGIKASKNDIRELFIKKNVITLYQNALFKIAKWIEQPDRIVDWKSTTYYMDYNSAKGSAGWDIYWFSNKYNNIDMETLLTMIFVKKKERELTILIKDRDEVLYQFEWMKKLLWNDAMGEHLFKLEEKINQLNSIIKDIEFQITQRSWNGNIITK